jgi:hypothetical protein
MKTLKHPLFKQEVAHVRWATLLFTIAILLPILLMLNEANKTGTYSYQMTSMDILTDFPPDILGWFTLPVLIISQFFYTRKESVYGMIAAMPFTRKERIHNKYIAGICAILFGYIVALLVLTAAFFSPAKPIIGVYAPLVYWFLIAFFSAVFQYSFLFLIGTIMGHSIFAGVGGFIIFYAPFFMVSSTLLNLQQLFGLSGNFDFIFKLLLPHYITYSGSWYLSNSVPQIEFMIITAAFAVLSLLLYLAAQKVFSKNDFEYNGNMCMFPIAEHIFLIGFTLCFGLLGLDVAQFFENGWLYPLAILIGFACFPAGYLLAKRLLVLTGHRIQLKKS